MVTLLLTAAIGQTYSVQLTGGILGQETLSLAPAPSGTQFVAGMANNSVRIFDAKTRGTVKIFSGNNLPPRAVAWSPKGNQVASGSENAAVRVWDVKSGNQVVVRPGSHLRNINAIFFSPDATKLVTTSDDDTTKVWSLASARPLAIIQGKGLNIYGSRFDPQGTRIYAGTLGQGLQMYNSAGVFVKPLGGHPGQGCADIDINKAGTLGATAGRDWTVGVWDLKKGTRISYLRGHGDWVTRVAFDPTGQFIASSSTDMTVRIWDAKALRQVAVINDTLATGSPIAWVDGGKMIVVVATDGFPRIYRFAKS